MNTTRTSNLVALDVIPGLPIRRLWNSTVLAYGCQDNPVMSDVELSELLCIEFHDYYANPRKSHIHHPTSPLATSLIAIRVSYPLSTDSYSGTP